MEPNRSRLATVVTLATLFVPGRLDAQFRTLPPPPAYALQNVTVVHADGRQEPGVNIVVRNGLIASLGVGIDIPSDAQLLEGDSLFVYPGMVDAFGTADFELPEIERDDSVRSWDAPRAVEGLLAHRRVADYLDLGGDAARGQRAAGIVASGVHPGGALAAGLAATVVHRAGTDRPWQSIANAELGLVMQFQGGQGAYPSTLFGIIAYMRQAFEDARRDGLLRTAYYEHPGGIALPALDPDYETLRSVMNGELPVFFTANGAEDIRRVLGLAEEYGFRPIIVGGDEAWRIADTLADRNVPVILDGDFPEPNEWEPEEAAPDSSATDTTAAVVDSMAVETPLEPAAAREKKRIENIRANAGRLAEAGVRFAISSGGGDANIRDAARLSIEYGLPADVALRAVTTVPAELLGIPSITLLGQGMAATFVVTSGPLFDEDTEIAHVFVDGSYEEGSSSAGGDAPTVNVTGEWTLTLSASGQEFEMRTTLTMEPDGSVRGSVSNDQFGTAPLRGRVSGNRMTFTITLAFGGQEFEITGEGSIEGDQMTGSGESPLGSFSLSGRKGPGGRE